MRARAVAPHAALLGAGLVLNTQAASAFERPQAYDVRTWEAREGVPQSSVTGLARGSDGTIWFTTFGGLGRFDGKHAEPIAIPPELVIELSSLTGVVEEPGPSPRIWISAVENGLWTWDGQAFTRPEQPDRLASASAYHMDWTGGRLFVSSNDGGFVRQLDGSWTLLSEDTVFDLDGTPDGGAWGCVEGDHLVRYAPDGEETLRLEMAGPIGGCSGATLDDAGTLWVLRKHGISRVLTDGSATHMYRDDVIPTWSATPIISSDQHVWVSANEELLDFGTTETLSTRMAEGSDPQVRQHHVGAPVRSWLDQPGGVLWLGLVGKGLGRLAPLGFSRWAVIESDNGGRGAGPLHGGPNGIWYSLRCGEVRHTDASGRLTVVEGVGLNRHGEGCLYSLWSRDGESAFAAMGSHIERVDTSGSTTFASWPTDDERGRATALLGREDGELWVGFEHGSFGRTQAGVIVDLDPPMPDRIGRVYSLLDLPDGSLAVGGRRGLCLYKHSEWRCLDAATDGIVPGPLRHLAVDSEGRLWMTSFGGGLGWIDDDGAGYISTTNDQLPERYLSAVHFGADGNVWLQGNTGMTRLREADLHRARRDPTQPIHWTLVDVGESNGWLRNSSATLDDGSLWLAGTKSIAVVETGSPLRDDATPPPRIQRFTVGEHDVPSGSSGEYEAPLDALRRLEVRYSDPATELGAENWYEHRLLTGEDESSAPWEPAYRKRSAVYSKLAPGSYEFQVRSISSTGVRSVPSTRVFRIPRQWWESALLVPLTMLGLLCMVLGGSFFRIRRAEAAAAELRDQISVRRAVEAKLQEREHHFRQVVREAANGFLLYNEAGKCIEANPAACRLFGLSREALLRVSRDGLGLPPARPGLAPGAEPTLASRSDGTQFPTRIMDVAFDGDGGQRILTSVVDLTSMVDAHNKERRLRRQLAGAQRLEALGRLAGGVAHDMNNILSALGNNVELIYELREEEPAEARMCLDDARASLSRGTALMEQLLAFRGRRARGTTNADASAVVDGLERLLRSLVPADRKMELTLSPTGAVQLEQTRLEQIVVNLVMNGSDACGPGGSLEISIRPSEDGQDCLLTVKDDGPGIDADVQQNIFDPFFTTKTLGNGTGLGLSTVKGLVDDADGEIRLETGPAGTTFHVRLPLSSKAAPAQALSPRGDAPAGAGRTMVLVDDDGAVRRSVARQLIRAGWQVEQYGDPLAALARLVGPEPPPDILVSDVVMPSLNGRQLVEAVRAEHPALPVLFISGYTGDVLGERVFQDAPLLFKPFAVEDLLAQVDVLAGARVEPAEDA